MKADHEGWIETGWLKACPSDQRRSSPARTSPTARSLPIDRMLFSLRGNSLFAFQDLRVKGNPFESVISGGIEPHRVSDWLGRRLPRQARVNERRAGCALRAWADIKGARPGAAAG